MTFIFYMAPMPRRGRKSFVSPSKIRPKRGTTRKVPSKSSSIVLRKSSAKTMKKPSLLSFFDGSTAKSARIFIGTAAGAVASQVGTYAAAEMLKKMQKSTVRIGGSNVRMVDVLNSSGRATTESMITTEDSSNVPQTPGGLGFGASRRKTKFNVVFGDARKMPKSPIQPVTVRMYSSTYVNDFGEPSKASSAGIISSSIGERTSRLFTYGISLPELQKRRIIAREDIDDAPVTGIETQFDPVSSAGSVSESSRYFPYVLDLQRKFTNLNQYLDAKVTITFVQFDSDEFSTDSNFRVSSPLTTFAQLYTSGVPDTMKTPFPGEVLPKYYNILYNSSHKILGDERTGTDYPRGAIQASTRSGYGIRNSLISDQMRQIGSRRTFTLRPGEVLECNVKRYFNENITQNGFANSYSLNSTSGGPLFAQNSTYMLVEVQGTDGEFYKVVSGPPSGTPPTYPRYRSYYRSSLTAYIGVDETIDITMYNKLQGDTGSPRYFRTFYSQYIKDELTPGRSLTPIVNSPAIIYSEPPEGQEIATARYVIPLTTNRVSTSASQIKVEEN